MFDPSEVSLWHVVGFAARVAIALNLHRRVDDTSLPGNVVEQRKRVFYSLYNLDRLVAATLSKPLAFADDDIDVEVGEPILQTKTTLNSSAFLGHLFDPPIPACSSHRLRSLPTSAARACYARSLVHSSPPSSPPTHLTAVSPGSPSPNTSSNSVVSQE